MNAFFENKLLQFDYFTMLHHDLFIVIFGMIFEIIYNETYNVRTLVAFSNRAATL